MLLPSPSTSRTQYRKIEFTPQGHSILEHCRTAWGIQWASASSTIDHFPEILPIHLQSQGDIMPDAGNQTSLESPQWAEGSQDHATSVDSQTRVNFQSTLQPQATESAKGLQACMGLSAVRRSRSVTPKRTSHLTSASMNHSRPVLNAGFTQSGSRDFGQLSPRSTGMCSCTNDHSIIGRNAFNAVTECGPCVVRPTRIFRKSRISCRRSIVLAFGFQTTASIFGASFRS